MAPVRFIVRMSFPMNILTCLLLHHHIHFVSLSQAGDVRNDNHQWVDKLGTAKSIVSYRKIYVDQLGRVGNFTTIQSAIDWVPRNNPNWVVIHIMQGTYREKVKIPYDKPYIVLKGRGNKITEVVWDDHETVAQSPTFTCLADNVIIKGISFRNSYNNPGNGKSIVPAVAALVSGDQLYFYKVGFFGVQDTLWDDQGRHYFRKCTIQGAVDFIFGNGQAIFKDCLISVLGTALEPDLSGFITAHGREDPSEPSGFVFEDCRVSGSGSALLGRPWRGYARVLFYHCSFSSVVEPSGWDAWGYTGHEYQLAFSEYNCYGPGADTLNRVTWERKLSRQEVKELTSMSFIDSAEWLYSLPYQRF